MTLVLYFKDKHQASWLVFAEGKIKAQHDFSLDSSQDSLLSNLDLFLNKNKLKLSSFSSLVLAIKQASLTQVKIATAMANILAWQYKWPIEGEFYFSGDLPALLPKIIKKLKNKKNFSLLKVKYERQPDISISKKKPKFRIKK